MCADGTHQRHLFVNRTRIFKRFSAIALFTRLKFHFIEIGIAQMLKEASCGSLGYAGHLRDFGSGMNQNVVLALENELRDFLLACRELCVALLYAQYQT